MASRKPSSLANRSRNRSAVLYGVAHALDLGGSLVRQRGRFAQGATGDALALRGDWDRALTQQMPTRTTTSTHSVTRNPSSNGEK